MKADLARREPDRLAAWDAMGLEGRIRRAARAGPTSSSTTARPTPTATSTSARDEQDPQGRRRAQPHYDGLRRAVRARLGLPRPADRAEGGQEARVEEAGHGHGGDPQRVPRVRAGVHRHPARGVPAPRGRRPLQAPVPDDELRIRGDDCPRLRRVLLEGSAVSRPEVGSVVLHRPDRARRSRARVRGARRTPRSWSLSRPREHPSPMRGC